jgi:uncharacterized protein YjbI with pentapeptide repeats
VGTTEYEQPRKEKWCREAAPTGKFFHRKRKRQEKNMSEPEQDVVEAPAELHELSQSEFDNILSQHKRYLEDRRPSEKPTLAHCRLYKLTVPVGCRFDRIDFTGCEINGLQFINCTFRNCDFSLASITSGKFDSCDFSHAKMRNARLIGWDAVNCQFRGVDMHSVYMHEGRFQNCFFIGIEFTEAKVEYTQFLTVDLKRTIIHFFRLLGKQKEPLPTLGRSKFEACSFQDASELRYIDFGESRLTDCDLREVDLATCTGFVFDNTEITQTRLPVATDEPWLILVRKYTGSRMLFNLIFLGIYFTPLIVKGILLLSLAQIELALINRFSVTNPTSEPSLLTQFADPSKACAALQCKSVPVYQLILGANVKIGILIAGMTLLFYNILRFILTIKVGPLKEEEALTGRTPPYFRTRALAIPYGAMFLVRLKGYFAYLKGNISDITNSYAPYWYGRRIISIIFYIAILLSLYHLLIFLRTDVLLPSKIVGL